MTKTNIDSILNIDIPVNCSYVAVVSETPTRGHKKKQRTRRQLIAAAIDVLGQQGEAFAISDITARAGVSNGTFYNYFEDRSALLEAVTEETIRAFAFESAAIVDDADPALRLSTITQLALRRAADDRTRVLLRIDSVQRAVLDGAVLSHLRADLEAGIEAGCFTAPLDEATVDVVAASVLLASRRIAETDVSAGYGTRVAEQLLRSLGVPAVEAGDLARRGADQADAVTRTRSAA